METAIKQHYWLVVYEVYSDEGVVIGKGNFTHESDYKAFTNTSHEDCISYLKSEGHKNILILGVNYLGEMTIQEAYGDGNS